MVVGLFGLFAYVGFRIASRSVDPFLRLLTSTITVLIVAQAFINIGYVIGILPVTGIQLPLVSAGGTSALTVLAMLGLMANAARHEPDAVAALAVGRRTGRTRWARLPAPVPYRAARVPTQRGKSQRTQDTHRREGGQVPSAPANRPSAARGGWSLGRGGTPRSAERTTGTRGAATRRARGATGRARGGDGPDECGHRHRWRERMGADRAAADRLPYGVQRQPPGRPGPTHTRPGAPGRWTLLRVTGLTGQAPQQPEMER